jgi:hypothetical protein
MTFYSVSLRRFSCNSRYSGDLIMSHHTLRYRKAILASVLGTIACLFWLLATACGPLLEVTVVYGQAGGDGGTDATVPRNVGASNYAQPVGPASGDLIDAYPGPRVASVHGAGDAQGNVPGSNVNVFTGSATWINGDASVISVNTEIRSNAFGLWVSCQSVSPAYNSIDTDICYLNCYDSSGFDAGIANGNYWTATIGPFAIMQAGDAAPVLNPTTPVPVTIGFNNMQYNAQALVSDGGVQIQVDLLDAGTGAWTSLYYYTCSCTCSLPGAH